MNEPNGMKTPEEKAIIHRYEKRRQLGLARRYSPLLPANRLFFQEREKRLLDILRARFPEGLAGLDILEIGCGDGGNLLNLIRWGAVPERLAGNDIFEDSLRMAENRLPSSVKLLPGDAARLDLAPESFDMVLHFTVFSSILDNNKQREVANKVWELLRPGGVILSYDFTFDNPKNPDVRAFTKNDLLGLYPLARQLACRRLTLAPPLARAVVRVHPVLYHVLNVLPALRTHLICMLEKPGSMIS